MSKTLEPPLVAPVAFLGTFLVGLDYYFEGFHNYQILPGVTSGIAIILVLNNVRKKYQQLVNSVSKN